MATADIIFGAIIQTWINSSNMLFWSNKVFTFFYLFIKAKIFLLPGGGYSYLLKTESNWNYCFIDLMLNDIQQSISSKAKILIHWINFEHVYFNFKTMEEFNNSFKENVINVCIDLFSILSATKL